MKILYLVHQFYPNWYTGTEQFVLNLATMMQKAGNRVKVMTYGENDRSRYDRRIRNVAVREFVYGGIPVIAVKHESAPEDSFAPGLPPRLHQELDNRDLRKAAKALIRREKPDVVHVAHAMRMGELVAVLARLRVPYVVTLTDFFFICPKYTLLTTAGELCAGPDGGRACRSSCPEFPNRFITTRLDIGRRILGNATLVVSPSRFLASVFQREWPDLDVRVVKHGTRETTLPPKPKCYANGDGITFAYAGSLNPHKGVHLLIDAFRKVTPSNARLRIYGSGPDGSYANALKAAAESDVRIEFCGVYPPDAVGDVLGGIDVLVLPSLWYENDPTILRQAVACAIPVVASNAGGMAEAISDGVTGFLFRLGDSQHLEEVLQRIASVPEMLNGVTRNLGTMDTVTIEQEAYAYARAYAQIGGGEPPRPRPTLARLRKLITSGIVNLRHRGVTDTFRKVKRVLATPASGGAAPTSLRGAVGSEHLVTLGRTNMRDGSTP